MWVTTRYGRYRRAFYLGKRWIVIEHDRHSPCECWRREVAVYPGTASRSFGITASWSQLAA